MHVAFIIVAIIMFVIASLMSFFETSRPWHPSFLCIGMVFFAAAFYVSH